MNKINALPVKNINAKLDLKLAQLLGFDAELVDGRVYVDKSGVKTYFSPSSNWWDARPLLEANRVVVRQIGNTGQYKAECKGFEGQGSSHFEAGLKCLYFYLKSQQN